MNRHTQCRNQHKEREDNRDAEPEREHSSAFVTAMVVVAVTSPPFVAGGSFAHGRYIIPAGTEGDELGRPEPRQSRHFVNEALAIASPGHTNEPGGRVY